MKPLHYSCRVKLLVNSLIHENKFKHHFQIILISIVLIGNFTNSYSQNYISGNLYNKGLAYCSGNLNNAGTFVNYTGGDFYLTGNLVNSGTTAYDGGTLQFIGSSLQTLSGSNVFYTTNVTINNSAGIELSKCLSVNSTADFTTGQITTPAGFNEPFEFSSTGNHTNTSNSSHVNGYVRKLGTGAFTYPVGDASNYQQVLVNPTANASGIYVKYFPADAGSAAFGTTGTDPIALSYYNSLEYWDITPVSTATGTVTVFWDSYENTGIGAPSDLRVAHLYGGQWLNEGIIGVGTLASGSVESNSLSSWSPFTLGSMSGNSPLPIILSSFDVFMDNCSVSLKWHAVAEINFSYYELQYSSDAVNFNYLKNITPTGNNSSYSYQYRPEQSNDLLYYRLKMVDNDGTEMYSDIAVINPSCSENQIDVYPTITGDKFNINTHSQSVSSCQLYDSRSKLVKEFSLDEGLNTVDIRDEKTGMYYLKINLTTGESKNFKILKIN